MDQNQSFEKQAVVRPGTTPSCQSGKKSSFVKNGNAYAPGENAVETDSDSELVKRGSYLYDNCSNGTPTIQP